MERRDLYEDDLTDERGPTPEQRDDVAQTLKGDPDVDSADDEPVEADEDDDDDEDDEDLDLLDE
jgi:hypothetical protein